MIAATHAQLAVVSLDERLGTMARFFLIAVAVVAPVAWWWLRRRRSSRGASDRPTGRPADRPASEADEQPTGPRDLGWLVAEIDRADPRHGVVELVVPTELARRVWGNDRGERDRVGAAVVADALRRSDWRVEVPRSPAAADEAVVVTLRPVR